MGLRYLYRIPLSQKELSLCDACRLLQRGGIWMIKTRSLVFVAILIAFEVILTRFLSIQTPIIRIGFGFIAIALSAMLFGPVIGGITAALGDILGMMIFPKGAFFPGFTISAFMGGFFYGLFLFEKPKSFIRITLAVFTIMLVVNLGLNTLWLSMITGNAYIALMVPRVIKEIVLFPIQILLIYLTWRYVGVNIYKHYNQT